MTEEMISEFDSLESIAQESRDAKVDEMDIYDTKITHGKWSDQFSFTIVADVEIEIGPGRTEVQLNIARHEEEEGNLSGGAMWLSLGLRIEEKQCVETLELSMPCANSFTGEGLLWTFPSRLTCHPTRFGF